MFEAGDLVRCVCSDGHVLKDGKTYTVERCVGKYVHVGTVPSDGWGVDRFELVEASRSIADGLCLIPVGDIPDGWEVVRIGSPKKGDWFYNQLDACPAESPCSYDGHPRIILRRKARPVTASDVGKTVRYGSMTDVLHAYGKVRCLLGEDGREVVDTDRLTVEAEATSGSDA